jgi:hypothetical protein
MNIVIKVAQRPRKTGGVIDPEISAIVVNAIMITKLPIDNKYLLNLYFIGVK